MPRRSWSRRGLLKFAAAGSLGVTLSGCDLLDRDPAVPPATADPLEPLITAETALLAQYDATLAAFPALAGRLAGARADHAAHLAALRSRVDPRRRSALASPSGSLAPSPSVAASARAARVALRTAETSAASSFRAACMAASGERAALLGSVAASEASHAAVLA